MNPTFFLFLLLISIPVLSQPKQFESYFFTGVSYYGENTDALVGDGSGVCIGLGTQFNDKFGLELRIDSAPPIDTEILWDTFSQVYDVSHATNYDIGVTGNNSFILAGTLTFPMDDKFSGILKAGYSNTSFNLYRFDVTVEEGYLESNLVTHDLTEEFEDKARGLFVSGGLLIDINVKSSIEISISHTALEEGESTSINGNFRYKF